MGFEPERIADGVWRLQGDIKGGMNVYFIEHPDGGVTMFDAGTRSMTRKISQVVKPMGGLREIVLGHADTDHRGSAAGLATVPIRCHPDARTYAERDEWPDYWDMDQIDWLPSKLLYPILHRWWDGGGLPIAGTVSEGDEVAGFRVVDLPGHAPGLIALFRDSDRLCLCSDAIYMVDSMRLEALPEDEAPTVPHQVWNQDTRQAAESVRKLAALEPHAVWPGHEHGVTGDPADIRRRLERAADRILGPQAAATPAA
jgi:glyoxylase-like metal-dependent hydrolase (beta-lactamase superfamily II)